MPQSFPRDRRLLKGADFKYVFAQPVKSSDAWFTVLGRPAKAADSPPRLGLAIARKQLRRAVDRNRIKRLIREYFRLYVAPVSHGIDYVVMVRTNARQQPNERLRSSLTKHFKQVQRRVGSISQTGGA